MGDSELNMTLEVEMSLTLMGGSGKPDSTNIIATMSEEHQVGG